MNELGKQARAILDAGRHLDEPNHVQRARVKRLLFARVASGGAAILATSGVAAGTLAKVALPVVLLLSGAAGGTYWWQTRQAAKPVPAARTQQEPGVAAPAPPPPAPEMPAPVVIPAPIEAPLLHDARRAIPARAAAASPTRDLAQETALLARVNEALRTGDPRRGLALADEYEQRFPAGVLRQEMLATRIIAGCQLTPGAAARQAAQRFLTRHPASPLAPRVRGSCLARNDH